MTLPPLPRPSLRVDDCPWCGSDDTKAEGRVRRCNPCGRATSRLTVADETAAERRKHGGGPRVFPPENALRSR